MAQSVEHRTGIAEVMGSNLVEASDFFSGLSLQLLKLLHNCEDHFHFRRSVLLRNLTTWFTYAEEGSRFLERITWHVHRPPLVRKLRALSFPGLEVQRGPDNVEDVESQNAPITCRFTSSRENKCYDAQKSGCYQPLGVHAKPREVHGDFYPEVLTDVV